MPVHPTQALVRTRTGNPFLTMEVLHQLSDEGRSAEPSGRPPGADGWDRIEPVKAEPSGLQPDPFDCFGTPPSELSVERRRWAWPLLSSQPTAPDADASAMAVVPVSYLAEGSRGVRGHPGEAEPQIAGLPTAILTLNVASWGRAGGSPAGARAVGAAGPARVKCATKSTWLDPHREAGARLEAVTDVPGRTDRRSGRAGAYALEICVGSKAEGCAVGAS